MASLSDLPGRRSVAARWAVLLRASRPTGAGLIAATSLLPLAAPLLPPPALASSPAAWAAYDTPVRAACRAASTLAGPIERGERLDLPGPGLSLLLLEGRYPQPHMQGKRGLELCVYEQATRRASVADAARLLGPLANSSAAGRPALGPPGMAPTRP